MRGLSVLLLALPFLALAQPPGLNEDRASGPRFEHKLERLNEHVSLDEDQMTQIRAVLESTSEEVHEAHQEMAAAVTALREARELGEERSLRRALQDAEDARETLHAIRKATDQEVQKLLTLEQRAMVFEMEVRRHHRGREGGERRRGASEDRGPRGDRDPESRRAFDKL